MVEAVALWEFGSPVVPAALGKEVYTGSALAEPQSHTVVVTTADRLATAHTFVCVYSEYFCTYLVMISIHLIEECDLFSTTKKAKISENKVKRVV